MRDIILNEIRKTMLEIRVKEGSLEGAPLTDQEQMLLDTANKLIELSDIARKEGLLALEEAAGKLAHTEADDTLRMLLMLVVDGTDPDLVEEMALIRYFALASSGYESLQCLMQITGVIDIQAGTNPRVLQQKIWLMLPGRVSNEFFNPNEIYKHNYHISTDHIATLFAQ